MVQAQGRVMDTACPHDQDVYSIVIPCCPFREKTAIFKRPRRKMCREIVPMTAGYRVSGARIWCWVISAYQAIQVLNVFCADNRWAKECGRLWLE